MPSGDCKSLMALPCLPLRCWCRMVYVFILITISWSSNATRDPWSEPFCPQSSILPRQGSSTVLIIKGCHYCHVSSNVRASRRQRRSRTANTSISCARLILPQMPVRVNSAILDMLVECQSIFPGILLPAYGTADLAASIMVGDHSNHRARVHRQHNFVSAILHIFHYW